MTLSIAAFRGSGVAPWPLRLVLAGVGPTRDLETHLPAAGVRLAGLLELPLLSIPSQPPPDAALATLQDEVLPDGVGTNREAGWIATLHRDPGLVLASGVRWAEVLGAWRQPTLLLFTPSQLTSTGWPAAATALLDRCRVPLVGLVQGGGSWEALERRRDGLPWLGRLAGAGRATEDDDDLEQALRLALLGRWLSLDRT